MKNMLGNADVGLIPDLRRSHIGGAPKPEYHDYCSRAVP